MASAESYSDRLARLPDDKPAILGFIMGLQRFENAIEPDCRVDAEVAEEFYPVMTERVGTRNGCILIAESAEGKALGWAVAYENPNEVYVRADERTYGYIAELYVVEEARGQGIGRAMIAACESWAKDRELKVMIIGSLARNEAAFAAYRSAGFADYATELRKYLR